MFRGCIGKETERRSSEDLVFFVCLLWTMNQSTVSIGTLLIRIGFWGLLQYIYIGSRREDYSY